MTSSFWRATGPYCTVLDIEVVTATCNTWYIIKSIDMSLHLHLREENGKVMIPIKDEQSLPARRGDVDIQFKDMKLSFRASDDVFAMHQSVAGKTTYATALPVLHDDVYQSPIVTDDPKMVASNHNVVIVDKEGEYACNLYRVHAVLRRYKLRVDASRIAPLKALFMVFPALFINDSYDVDQPYKKVRRTLG